VGDLSKLRENFIDKNRSDSKYSRCTEWIKILKTIEILQIFAIAQLT